MQLRDQSQSNRGIAIIAAIPIPADSTVAATSRRKKASGTYTVIGSIDLSNKSNISFDRSQKPMVD
jgi:hypothetical protein